MEFVPVDVRPAAALNLNLDQSDLDPDPIKQFAHWFAKAVEAKVPEPNAMTLATANREGVPSARIVLLKGFDQHGFLFFTNYDSQKGRELSENPNAALVLFWPTLERQVRVVGPVARIDRAQSEAYFHSRPVGSQLGALVSKQSQPLSDRRELEGRVEELARKYVGQTVPLPDNWGGFCLSPTSLEFWQARLNRLHDRFRYARAADGSWKMVRLWP
jgi:pyridoxamine 5'-phosphate oxidase